jgi:hypothetical protein
MTFDPTPFATVIARYRSDSGVYSDAGVTLATNTQAVQQWNDLGASGWNLSQATLGSRPTYATNQLFGHPGLNFDWTIPQLISNASVSATAPLTVFIVCSDSNVSSGQIIFDGLTGRCSFGIAGAGNFFAFQGGANATSATVDSPFSAAVISISFASGALSLWKNGVLKLGPATGGSNNLAGLTLGSSLGAGAICSIYEVLIVAGTLTTGNRNSIEAGLNTDWLTAFVSNPITVAASSAAAAILIRSDLHGAGASCVTSAKLIRAAGKSIGASSASTAVVVRSSGKGLSAASASIPKLIRQAGKSIAASSTTLAALATSHGFGKLVSAASGTAATLSRGIGKGISASSASSASLFRTIGKSIGAGVTGAGAIFKQARRTVSASSASSAVVAASRAFSLRLSATVTTAASSTATLMAFVGLVFTRLAGRGDSSITTGGGVG